MTASKMARTGARTTIAVHGARVHNLKNISVEIPRDTLIVITGLSGSGKRSLAFDTIYAEGQRRYMESLSSYAKRFVAQVAKPDVDFIYGLSPVISIEQKTGEFYCPAGGSSVCSRPVGCYQLSSFQAALGRANRRGCRSEERRVGKECRS